MRHRIITKSFLAIMLSFALLFPVAVAQTSETSGQELPKTLYIVPFLNVMVPEVVSSTLFDDFIDQVMIASKQWDIEVLILKQDIDVVDKGWLAQQHFITGEVFGYLEESGCCSTEIEAKARIYRYQPGSTEPVGEFVVPDDTFFDHDMSTLERERAFLAGRMAQELSGLLFADLLSSQ